MQWLDLAGQSTIFSEYSTWHVNDLNPHCAASTWTRPHCLLDGGGPQDLRRL